MDISQNALESYKIHKQRLETLLLITENLSDTERAVAEALIDFLDWVIYDNTG